MTLIDYCWGSIHFNPCGSSWELHRPHQVLIMNGFWGSESHMMERLSKFAIIECTTWWGEGHSHECTMCPGDELGHKKVSGAQELFAFWLIFAPQRPKLHDIHVICHVVASCLQPWCHYVIKYGDGLELMAVWRRRDLNSWSETMQQITAWSSSGASHWLYIPSILGEREKTWSSVWKWHHGTWLHSIKRSAACCQCHPLSL